MGTFLCADAGGCVTLTHRKKNVTPRDHNPDSPSLGYSLGEFAQRLAKWRALDGLG